MEGPLEGIKILDFTWALAGSYGIMVLGDLGADIVKVEPPTGDRARRQGPKIDGVSTYFFSVNRGKKSIILDLQTIRGKDIALKLVKLADVVAENFTPGTMQRLGLGYEVMKQHNPKVVYAALSGFGQTGPYNRKPALDAIVQAMGGLMSITGAEDGEPTRAGASIGDIGGGLFLAIGILAALEEARRSGRGQMLDLSMLDCQAAILENAFVRYFATGEIPRRLGSKHPVAAIHQVFPTKDGHIAIVAIGGIEQWATFLEIIGRLDILPEEKYHTGASRARYVGELEPILTQALKAKPTSEWVEKLEAVGIPCGPVNSIADAAKDPQLLHRNMFVDLPCPGTRVGKLRVSNTPFRFSRTPPRLVQGAPRPGEHTEEILTSLLHMSAEEITSLRDEGIISPREQPI